MAGEQPNYQASPGYSTDPAMKLRDLEDKQRILKNQMLLLGKNLIEIREKNNKELLEIRKDLEILKGTMERLASFVSSVSDEFSGLARKSDVEILEKQIKMFQPFIKKR